MIDDFLSRWAFTRGMTIEFLEHASDHCLDIPPSDKFMTIREQAVNLVEVQGAYQLALTNEPTDFSRKPEFTPAQTDSASLVRALGAQDEILRGHLEHLRDKPDAFKLDWYGTELGISGFGAVFIQHEALHHGQWAAHCALGGFQTPTGWIMNWGLFT